MTKSKAEVLGVDQEGSTASSRARATTFLSPERAFQAVDGAADLVEFAYEHGFHEEGFNRPAMLRALAEMLRPRGKLT